MDEESHFFFNGGYNGDNAQYHAELPFGIVSFGLSKINFYIGNLVYYIQFVNSQPVSAIRQVSVDGNSGQSIIYPNLYPGISLIYKNIGENIKYEFVISPFSYPEQIIIQYFGIDDITIDDQNLLLSIGANKIIDANLNTYYQDNEAPISSNFQIIESNTIKFELPQQYDRHRQIVIDPLIMSYSTYFGSSGNDVITAVKVDSESNVIVGGVSSNITNIPFSFNDTLYLNNDEASLTSSNIFITKITDNGDSLIFSRLIGGPLNDEIVDLIIDNEDNIFILGRSQAPFYLTKDYRTTDDPVFSIVLIKISSNGEFLWATTIGGSGDEVPKSLAIDNRGNILIAGYTNSNDFPLIKPLNFAPPNQNSTFQGFIIKLEPTYRDLLFSSYFGGSGIDQIQSILPITTNQFAIVGNTNSFDFPVTKTYFVPSVNQSDHSDFDAFITTLTTSEILSSTLIGGSLSEFVTDAVIDKDRNIVLTGSTFSPNFPILDALQEQHGSLEDPFGFTSDGFFIRINSDSQKLSLSTFLGGSFSDNIYALAVDDLGDVYFTGSSNSLNFPLNDSLSYQPYETTCSFDGGNTSLYPCFESIMGKITFDNQLQISSYLPGGNSSEFSLDIALDKFNNMHLVGYTDSENFHTLNPIFANSSGNRDGFFTKIFVQIIIHTTVDGLSDGNILEIYIFLLESIIKFSGPLIVLIILVGSIVYIIQKRKSKNLRLRDVNLNPYPKVDEKIERSLFD